MTDAVFEHPVVLLIESPVADQPSLASRLDSAGYTIWQAGSGCDARRMLAEARRVHAEPEIIILDRLLPDVDGLVLSAFLRADSRAPIVVCSSALPGAERTLGYQVGVDGFVESPPDLDELEALITSLLRRSAAKPSELMEDDVAGEELRIGSLAVHERNQSATIDSRPLALTPTQYRVLAILAKQPDATVTTEHIARTVWKCDADDGVSSLIATQVARVRAKLRDRSPSAPSIVSVPGRGYRLLAA